MVDKQQRPHITSGLMTGSLRHVEALVLKHHQQIEAWFREQWQCYPAPITSSVDLRNAGFKLAPVDTNLFPAGFNNLAKEALPLCIQAMQASCIRLFPTAKKFILIAENHTRNVNYYESLASLFEIIQKAGFEVRIGSLLPNLTQPSEVDLPSGRHIVIEPLVRTGDKISVAGFTPCAVILNNDLSDGLPPILMDLDQAITPPLALGWHQRLKSDHFRHYQAVCDEIADALAIDPWLLNPLFRNCGEVDFLNREGEDCLVMNSDKLLKDVSRKYAEYGIEQKPFVIIKADAGSYGMGVMRVRNSEEIHQLSRKQRSRMAKTKGQKVTQAIIQEGVYTFETVGLKKAVAEPVVYMIGPHVVGGFYRIHTSRGIDENLNAPGMHFEPMAFSASCITPDESCEPNHANNLLYTYGVVARLALLAAAREVQKG